MVRTVRKHGVKAGAGGVGVQHENMNNERTLPRVSILASLRSTSRAAQGARRLLAVDCGALA